MAPTASGGTSPHSGGHVHGAGDHRNRRALRWSLGITLAFLVLEAVGGWLANSLALLSDAGHMASDAAALGLSLFAFWFARRPAPAEKTYGYRRTEVLAALANAAGLLVISGLILHEAYRRLLEPPQVAGPLMLAVAVAGLAANLASAWMLHGGDWRENLNLRGAFLHVLGDLAGSVGAIGAAVIISFTGWNVVDPLVSGLIALLIVVSGWRLLRESLNVLMEGAPPNLSYQAVEQALCAQPGVAGVHDLHIWTITSGFPALSCHVVLAREAAPQALLERLRGMLRDRFGLDHVTIQVERETMVGRGCSLCGQAPSLPERP
ncbi:cation diffusion facilitator family transporter [Limnochorda pilosa]|uniref:Zinc transporter ZitB n=1 Tax=Limnochorda pilosa TaxID=1555112 RepID=A0A0K2SHH7_LIMPI|nr:cation diffusion facilitator family transporter [Limnochorda pilosa]BAS26571.1 zinc transporter ZitB [Limnochorda pilosa]